MSRTSPESEFSLIAGAGGKGGIILWSDGHSISAVSISNAFKAGMKYFKDYVDEDGENYIYCSKEPLDDAVIKQYEELWLQENDFAV